MIKAYHMLLSEGKDKILYKIMPDFDARYFSINNQSGEISSLKSFDYEERKFYGFQVSTAFCIKFAYI